MAPFDGSAWEEEDDEAAPPPDVPYYNNFPGKQPPPGGLIDMRTRPGATLVREAQINTAGGCNVCIHMLQQTQTQAALQLRDDILLGTLLCVSGMLSFDPSNLKDKYNPVGIALFDIRKLLLTLITFLISQRRHLFDMST